MRLEGKVAIITGGARGQGAAEAKLFAREGAKVIVGDMLDQEGAAVAAEIAEAGGAAEYVYLDVTSEQDWNRAIEVAISRFGKLNVLVNNAGIWRGGVVEDTTSQQWDLILDVNLKGPFLGIKLVIPQMRNAGGGSIINVGSSASLVGDLRSAAYGASKGGLRMLTKSTAIQYAKEGIRVNAIHPGPVETPMYYAVRPDPESRAAGVARTVMGRIGIPEDIAYGALYLASDEASYVTGIDLAIDGGLTAQ